MQSPYPKKKGITQFPDKYQTRYPETPPVGVYNVDAADRAVFPRSLSPVTMKGPLNLYAKPPSVRPEFNDNGLKPFGSDAKDGTISPGPRSAASRRKLSPGDASVLSPQGDRSQQAGSKRIQSN